MRSKAELQLFEALNPLFAEAGLGLYEAQAYEYMIKYFLELASRSKLVRLDKDDMLKILNGESKKTIGQLIGILTKSMKISEGFNDCLTSALRARNNLIHNYFSENIDRIFDISNREKLLNEIREIRNMILKGNEMLEPFVAEFARMVDGVDIRDIKQSLFTKTSDKL